MVKCSVPTSIHSRHTSWIAWVLALGAAFPAQAADDDANVLLNKVGQSVVRLDVGPEGDSQGNGTGFLVRADGIVVTNHHVVEHLKGETAAVLLDGTRHEILGLLADDEEHDVAVVKIAGSAYPFLELAPSETVKAGTEIVVIGSPHGLDQSVGLGIISAVRMDGLPAEMKKHRRAGSGVATGPMIQHTAPSAPGASGSPIVDRLGRVVGVNHSGFDDAAINFGAHVDVLRSLLAVTNLDAPPQPIGEENRWRNLLVSLLLFGGLYLAWRFGITRLDSRQRPTRVHWRSWDCGPRPCAGIATGCGGSVLAGVRHGRSA